MGQKERKEKQLAQLKKKIRCLGQKKLKKRRRGGGGLEKGIPSSGIKHVMRWSSPTTNQGSKKKRENRQERND